MPFCKNCGYKLLEPANFCPQCGQQLKQVKQEEAISPPEEKIPAHSKRKTLYQTDQTFTILEEGSVFDSHYLIEKVLGRDNDGITYLAKDNRNGEKRSLKLYHKAYFDSVEKLFSAVSRLSNLKTIDHPNFAKVYDLNQSHRPVYIASEYIEGNSLAMLKEANPYFLNEERARLIAKQVSDAAIAIRQKGLSLRNLSLTHVILTEEDKAVVLSAGLSFDDTEEKEDIFNFGIFLAKLFSTSAFYETLYTPSKLSDRKFDYIPGITEGTNEVIAGCLHRNTANRYASFQEVRKALINLKPIKQKDIVTSSESGFQMYRDRKDVPKIDKRLDLQFWGAIVLIIAFIMVLLTTNLLDTIFGRDKTAFKFTGFAAELPDTSIVIPVADDSYRKIKPINPILRRNTGRDNNAQQTAPIVGVPSPQTPVNRSTDERPSPDGQQTSTQNAPITDKFVYIFGDTFAFGSLKRDAQSNVSLSGYYISRTEVTQAEWNKYMKAARFSMAGDNLPADNITWYEAVLYCNKRSEDEGLTPCYKFFGTSVSPVVTCNFKANGYRLPTEAEWEYAARAQKLTIYSGAEAPGPVAWYKDNATRRIQPVRTKSPNFFGLYDMTGNVSEWCWDWFDANYPKIMPFINPTGPETGTSKVVRGGNAETPEGNSLELTYRSKALPGTAYKYIGFRVVRGR